MSRILVVDDEPRIVDVVRAYLERDGHDVAVAHDGEAALASAEQDPPDLVVLDVMLPGRSGFDVLRALRAGGPGPAVILLTARDDVIDRVAGLELGADDYVTKPFEPRELVARVGAVLRRMRSADAVAAAPEPSTGGVAPGSDRPLQLLGLDVDPAAREVRREGSPVELTRSEFDLLLAFAEQPDRAWTREQLGERVHGEAFDAFDRSIDSHVKNLRSKLGPRPDGGSYVETVRGIGYRAGRPLP
ncbi:MAG: response regulator transcription factor [Chloroflexi bacterium]|jgi:DNA-binding response OmpR family regulator|nr:response regulator transcription factor [Chloroflexota bacterium]